MANLPELPQPRLTGHEHFHRAEEKLDISVLEFWQWSASRLAANNLRGHVAEFLVASDLDVSRGTRWEWDDFDLQTDNGYRIEVKSASYIQQWRQTSYSKISFGIAPTRGWDRRKQRRTSTQQRNSEAYVFCLLKTKNQNKFDILDLSQWVFFVAATAEINRKLGMQKTMTLSRLKSLNHIKCDYGQIAASLQNILNARKL